MCWLSSTAGYLGWEIGVSQDDYVEISDGSIRILFTRVDGYQGAGWPTSDTPKRYHLCLQADDMGGAVRAVPGTGRSQAGIPARW